MLNATKTSTSQNDKIDAHLPLETHEAPADTFTDDGYSENTRTFERECEPIYPFRFWCLPDPHPPSSGTEPNLDTHIDETHTIDVQTPETVSPDLTPDSF